jgi:hypothetical protein
LRCVDHCDDHCGFVHSSSDKTVKFWDLRSQTCTQTFSDHLDQVLQCTAPRCHAFSVQHAYIAACAAVPTAASRSDAQRSGLAWHGRCGASATTRRAPRRYLPPMMAPCSSTNARSCCAQCHTALWNLRVHRGVSRSECSVRRRSVRACNHWHCETPGITGRGSSSLSGHARPLWAKWGGHHPWGPESEGSSQSPPSLKLTGPEILDARASGSRRILPIPGGQIG